jgi:hypothetical protein
MKVYKVSFKDSITPVGVVAVHGKVTIAHPSLGRVEGKSIEEVKAIVKKKKGSISKVR